MATTPKAPAKKQTAPAPANESADGFDFSNLAPVEEEAPIKHTRNGGVNPMLAHLTQSKETGKTLSVTVPADQAKKVVNLLRKAGEDAGIGVSLQTVENTDGTVKVKFLGRERRTRKTGK